MYPLRTSLLTVKFSHSPNSRVVTFDLLLSFYSKDNSVKDFLLPIFTSLCKNMFVLLTKCLPSFLFISFSARLLCVFSLHGFRTDQVSQMQPRRVPAQLERGDALPPAKAVRPRLVPATVVGGSALEDCHHSFSYIKIENEIVKIMRLKVQLIQT